MLRRKTLSLVLIEEIGKDVYGRDKTVLTEFQITLILYTYESLGGVVIYNLFWPRLENLNKSLIAIGLLYLKTLKTSKFEKSKDFFKLKKFELKKFEWKKFELKKFEFEN